VADTAINLSVNGSLEFVLRTHFQRCHPLIIELTQGHKHSIKSIRGAPKLIGSIEIALE
jgi:hypothetical protein